MKSAELDGRMVSERRWKDGEEFRVKKKVRKEVGDSVRSLIPAIVRGSALLMCWGSHIATENLSLSRHASCACTCVSATLVCCYHTCPIAKPPVNTFISWGDQSVKNALTVDLTTWDVPTRSLRLLWLNEWDSALSFCISYTGWRNRRYCMI